MDVLTDVLQTVRVNAACYGRVELKAPWGVLVPSGEHALFHVVIEGSCWLEVAGEEPMLLSAGDVVAVPQGSEHVLRDDPTTVPRPLQEMFDCREPLSGQLLHAVPNEARSVLVSGCLRFEDRHNNPLLSVLPRVVLVQGEHGRAVRWLETTLQFIACEAASDRPGAATVMNRLADILFIQLVRAYLAGSSESERGWLRALSEPQVGTALGLIHQNPEQSWTVAVLASKVGMSRSAFASRFTQLVGEPPLHYVTRWRMQKAAGMLRAGHATLAEIAERVGYESEAAFSKAFKRWAGAAPGAYRRAARGQAMSAAA